MALAFEQLSDEKGVIVFGWATERVIYARFEETISAELGSRFARRLAAMLARSSEVLYFADSSAVSAYEVSAFTTVTKAIVAKRDHLERIVARPWAGVIGRNAEAFAQALGCIEYIIDSDEFDARLGQAASRPIDQLLAAVSAVHPRTLPVSQAPESARGKRLAETCAAAIAPQGCAPMTVAPAHVQDLNQWRSMVAKRLGAKPPR